ncbi:two component transcriptional regulator, LuxR family [Vibrio metschnikovii]|uniref:response regulator transcription factor n=1 Tax=Vibrio TaxID=662 RepID=UPI0001B94113|nr:MULTISPECIES: response regulator transcription factor [Vibrio]EEX36184.1 two component transcriptional regulator LuxR family [Vibrio metschnikovii CIP 69.14]MBC3617057.1 response regulator transcription factor [Vibrio metschnikovii]MBC5813208.1 response regulator transcription factor [Vibrio metschnikovii]NNN61060.1 response regulator transcription factor [Vibrio sp. A11]SUP50273.1 two component transcriptional regulator, LuxR family [Vibrio metschnikovii]
MMNKNTVIIVDDHPVIVMALSALLTQHGYEVVATTDNGVDALNLTKLKKPNILLLDIGIPMLDGLEVIKRLENIDNPPKVLVLTAQPSNFYANRALLSGASGFLSKNADISYVIEALKAISSGYKYFPDSLNFKQQIEKDNDLSILSPRELTVFNYLVSGMPNKEIAKEMILSSKTISTYKNRILEKLNAKNIIELSHIANNKVDQEND